MSRQLTADPRQKLLQQVSGLADIAIFGTLSESYRTCGRKACRCYGAGPKHGPHLQISYRGVHGKTTGYYVPKAAQPSVREGVAAWNQLQDLLRQVAEMNVQRTMENARCDGAPTTRESEPIPASPKRVTQRRPTRRERAGPS